jgi:large subunit ribosomal protein L14e
MGLYDVGRVCIKIAGRDARKKCVVVDILDNMYVMIDGETRRRKCNVAHLEPLHLLVDIKTNASNEEVVQALKTEGIVCEQKKDAKKQPQPRPKKQKVVKKKAESPEKKEVEKKAEGKTEKKSEAKPKAAKKE